MTGAIFGLLEDFVEDQAQQKKESPFELDPISWQALRRALMPLERVVLQGDPDVLLYAGHQFRKADGGARLICDRTEQQYAELELAS